jgi:DUF971 family protein
MIDEARRDRAPRRARSARAVRPTGERLLDPATVPTDLTVTTMNLVGNYGVSIAFSDGHSTGIYRFRELYANRPGRS